MITLVVAYNNQSCKVTHYWVAQGHDTDSYVADANYMSYTGNTTFNKSAVLYLRGSKPYCSSPCKF
jgi:hypothetical protein